MELKAISIAYENLLKQTDDSVVPYFSTALRVLGEQFINYPDEQIPSLKAFYNELSTISRHLLELAPMPPSLDPMELAKLVTNDELVDSMLKLGLINSLAKDLYAIQSVIDMRLAMFDHGVNTGAFYETH
ncbi:hypothetical protein appser6_8370 [Actinobacillus pleuropneumoniae serovar 6 str. Femo]|uniref:Uncharacterized protein n=1 Tax=Actinobacillus pleuropneumoniae serovar 6 str. Femo TaxID=754256 RepID=A0A828PUK5_ACTPL|nr:hypothetical protein appser6_8370 [Actinobacillus pleuropneumoniae serovar 6 str. Femo]